jgi:hypothetical protein
MLGLLTQLRKQLSPKVKYQLVENEPVHSYEFFQPNQESMAQIRQHLRGLCTTAEHLTHYRPEQKREESLESTLEFLTHYIQTDSMALESKISELKVAYQYVVVCNPPEPGALAVWTRIFSPFKNNLNYYYGVEIKRVGPDRFWILLR